MDTSVLKSIKKVLGLDPEYDVFDADIIMHINSILSNLTQIGVGPRTGVYIEDDSTTWGDLFGVDPRFNNIKSYVYLKVRLLFDPPQNSNITNAMNEQIKEFEWRINAEREEDLWEPETSDTAITFQTVREVNNGL